MNQAIKMSEVENGAVEHWYMDCGISSSPTCSTEEVKDWFKNYLGKDSDQNLKQARVYDLNINQYVLDTKEKLSKKYQYFCNAYFIGDGNI